MRTPLLLSPAFNGHDTGSHPERPGRYRAIVEALGRAGLLDGRPELSFTSASDEAILRAHDAELLAYLEEGTHRGGGWIDNDTFLAPDSLAVARLAAGAGIAAVDHVLAPSTDHPRAFVLGRPPGHHAERNRAMGFCLLNSIAIGAAHAIANGLDRVAIVDWDVHHGNGTQDIYYGRRDLFFCSMHQWPLYPGTGASSERGIGAGEGFTLNLPLPAGSDDATYLATLDEVVAPAVRAYAPELILVSAGYDAHVRDPLANMRVTSNGFRQMTRRLVALAEACSAGRLVFMLEGGYDLEALGTSVVASIEELDANRD